MNNLIKNIGITATALLLTGATVSAQNLADARKAITAEQYQKAKSILKGLTVSEPTKDENYFYLGWVYIIQEYTDSAKTCFNKGISINPKSALNYAGLGAAARLDKDQPAAKQYFDSAMQYALKDSRPYMYIGKAYLLPPIDFNSSVAALLKGKEISPKDAELAIALGDTYLSQLQKKASEAYSSYAEAATLDPKSAAAQVSLGKLVEYANNYQDAEADFKKAIALDAEFGPAYREWAETDLRWAQNDPSFASAKIKEGLEHFQKFLSLTDMSDDSRLRYMAFLYEAGDFKTLQPEALAMSQHPNVNLRVFRYLGYAALENKDYATGLPAMQKFVEQAGPKRIIPRDYLTLGRLQIATKNDSLGVQALRKAYDLDSTQADVFKEIAGSNYKKGKFPEAAEAYRVYNERSRQSTLNDHLSEGLSYYKWYTSQRFSTANPKPVPDTLLLRKADSIFTYVQHKAPTANTLVAYYQARANDFREPSTNSTLGLAKPFYEQYIALVTAKGVTDPDKPLLSEAYDYLGRYYGYQVKDDAKAAENYTKALQYDPADKEAQEYLSRKNKKS